MNTWRLVIFLTGLFLGFGLLFYNLYFLQIEKGKFYTARAESQFRLSGLLEPKRGIIYLSDKNNNLIPAALNKDYPVVYAVPKQIVNPERTAKVLAGMFDISEDLLVKRLNRKDDSYELIDVKISPEKVQAVKAESLSGVYTDSKEFRFYPFDTLAAHIIGFVGSSKDDDDLKGRYGLEAYLETVLRGERGSVQGVNVVEPVQGSDIVLTIDRNIQAQAEEILKKTIEERGAEGGSVIVEEAKTGKILALANFPSFSPNEYPKFPVKNFLNPAVQAIYEPGSVFKVITMAAGIDSGKITPETSFYDSGTLTVSGRKITNFDNKAYGRVTMAEVIEHSINTGAAYAVQATGKDIFYDYLLKFGFDKMTGISLPGEIKTNLKNLSRNAPDINFSTAAFGQGVAVTPLSLIAAISAIANDGVLMKPYLLADQKPVEVRRVISRETAAKVKQMMISAVENAGIATIPNFKIAGKTGTAQIPDFEKGGYSDQYIHTFAGFAPAKDPRFVILFKIDKPKVGALAALTVVPAFRELTQLILNYYNVPPDDLETSH